jgi:hypothetical protein
LMGGDGNCPGMAQVYHTVSAASMAAVAWGAPSF